jgi:alkanesulfonate monooxygenase SsuD/methylene tetrahydromethanopterin reductase-like flavin-dependent oxidoreductase (luciferase family)
MFGVDLREHDDRYAYSQEWLNIVKRIWSEEQPFDHDGEHFHLKGVLSKPKHMLNSRPILVSAGNSETGRAFAAQNADCLFTAIPNLDDGPATIAYFRAQAPDGQLRNIFSSAHLMYRRTRKEAQDYHHYIVHDMGDWEAAEYAANFRGKRAGTWMSAEKDLQARLILGSGYPIIGSYDDAVETFQKMADLGLDGLALGLINYIDDLPHIRDEILPRIERVGLRLPHREAADA